MSATVTVERAEGTGYLLFSALHDGQLVRRTYVGYTKREAERDFRRLLRGT